MTPVNQLRQLAERAASTEPSEQLTKDEFWRRADAWYWMKINGPALAVLLADAMEEIAYFEVDGSPLLRQRFEELLSSAPTRDLKEEGAT